MITTDGKRLINSVIANRDVKIGTHIALGLNIFYDASEDGSVPPYTHNKYHSPYIVDEIPIANVGIIDGSPDEIVFSGQAGASKKFIANNIGLVARRFAGEIDEQETIVSVNSSQWTPITEGSIAVDPAEIKNFTEDGHLLLDNILNISRTYSDRVILYGKAPNDVIAFPFTVHNTTNPIGINVTLKFKSHDLQGNITVSEFTRSIGNNPVGIGYLMSGDNTKNAVPQLTDPYDIDGKRHLPFLWQARIDEFSDFITLLANGDAITETEISVSSGVGSYAIACGSIKLTPDNISNFYRITTGYRKLLRVLYKTDEQAYVNAEYRILGV